MYHQRKEPSAYEADRFCCYPVCREKENPDNLTVAVVMALNAIKQGHSATIILMVKAVALGQPGAANGVDIGAPLP